MGISYGYQTKGVARGAICIVIKLNELYGGVFCEAVSLSKRWGYVCGGGGAGV
jgi:hypothetical protein